jgi:hypothetical protein
MRAPYLVAHDRSEYLPARSLSSLLPSIGSSQGPGVGGPWRREDHDVRIRQWMKGDLMQRRGLRSLEISTANGIRGSQTVSQRPQIRSCTEPHRHPAITAPVKRQATSGTA